MNQMAKELYSTELFEQLKRAYDQRIEELSKAFTLAIQRIEESQVLQEMKGDDLAEYRIQHIAEIAKQVINNEQQLNIEQYLRNNSQLKAQLAVHKMEITLANKRTPEKDKEKQKDSRKTKQLEEEVKYLKKQIDMRDAQELNLENLVDKEIKNRIKMIEAQYILRDQHLRILQEKEREFSSNKGKKDLKEEKEQASRLIIQKYERVLEGERRNHEQGIKGLKQKYEYLVKELSKQNQALKAKVDVLQSKLVMANKKLDEQMQYARSRKQTEEREQKYKMEYPIEQKVNIEESLSRHLTQKSRALKQFKLLEDLQQLEHFRSRVKKQVPFSYEQSNKQITPIKYSKKTIQEPFQMQRLQSKRSSEHIQKVYDNNYIHPRSPKGNISPRWQDPATKFDQIQNSFAKQLAELRSKMTDKREKPYSPDNRRNPYIREDSVKRRLQQTTTQYSPKYTIKNYHHY